MKTVEEIEQLASKRFTIKQFIGEDDYNRSETIAARCGYVKGYTQCQEDMVNKIKLVMDAETFLKEFDSKIEFSMIDGGSIRANHGDILELMEQFAKLSYEQGLKDGYACMPSINSLNKQD